jgi:hypothetical protein
MFPGASVKTGVFGWELIKSYRPEIFKLLENLRGEF